MRKKARAEGAVVALNCGSTTQAPVLPSIPDMPQGGTSMSKPSCKKFIAFIRIGNMWMQIEMLHRFQVFGYFLMPVRCHPESSPLKIYIFFLKYVDFKISFFRLLISTPFGIMAVTIMDVYLFLYTN